MIFNWGVVALSAGSILLGSLVHGIAGFGSAQVSMGLMPLFRDPASATAIFGIVAVVNNLRVWWSVKENFHWKDWLISVAGLAAGLPIGIIVLSQLSESQLRLIIGITLLIAVIMIVLLRELKLFDKWFGDKDIDTTWYLGLIAGFFAGILGGAVAIPGPPMIIYGAFMLAIGAWKSKRMKAIFTAFFGTLMLYRSITITITGQMTLELFLEALMMVPGMLLGAWLGIKIYNHIPDEIFQWFVLILLTVNAFILIFI
jgi:uncharacterized protein